MLNQRKYTGDGLAWNTMPDMKLESLRRRGGGGISIFGRGVCEKGGSSEPPGNGPAVFRP